MTEPLRAALLAIALLLGFCGCGGPGNRGPAPLPCAIDADCPVDHRCGAGFCVAVAQPVPFDAQIDGSDTKDGDNAEGDDWPSDVTEPDASAIDSIQSTDTDAHITAETTANDAAPTDAAGACKSAYECSDDDPCTADLCTDGACSNGAKAPGCCAVDADCDDNLGCTADACIQNQCAHPTIGVCCQIGLQCDDGDPCTDELCDKGLCTHSAVPGCDPNRGGGGNPSCGDGACDEGEACQSCPQDCGACGTCGDGTCGFAESCQSCAQDCGSCTSTKCTPGGTCCTAAGQYAPKGLQCGTSKLSKTYVCSATGNGSDVMLSYKVGGCAGTSTLCSTSSSYAVQKVETYKACSSSQKCQVTSSTSPGTCVQGDKCTPGSKCCPDGQYAAKGTKCATSVSKKVYSCSSASKGATIYLQEAFAGCTGTSTTCSTSSSYLSWTGLQTYKKCSSSQYCKVSSSGTSGSCSSTAP